VLPSRGEAEVHLPEGSRPRGEAEEVGVTTSVSRWWPEEGQRPGMGARREAARGGRRDHFMGCRISRKHFILQAYNLSLDQLT
jgi:hypothetical protein